ncbi:MAG: DegT/DnrJ/EryC1/StrS family aminotransferase, partial [Parachlamydiaceae bacterium]
IVPVHFAGIAVDMKFINDSLKNPNAVIIEDAAHAIGSYYPSGERVGSCAYSDMTVLSFHPAKTMTTGEGGAVTTNSESLYKKLCDFRNNGIRRKSHWEYDCISYSGNYHMNEMQGALGVSQLKRLDKFIEKRRLLVKRYRENLKGIEGIRLFSDKPDDYTAYHLMVLQIDMKRFGIDRNSLIQKLKEENIGTQYHYIPLYRHPVLEKAIGDLSSYFPNMEKYYQEALSFPLYYDLEVSEVDRIVNTLKRILKI